ncbi:MAG: hypothetical protein ABIM36_04530 [candidate division WOR-3 bacterium]
MTLLLSILVITQSEEYKILLKKRPPSLYPFIMEKKIEEPSILEGDTLRIVYYWWYPDKIAYVTDTFPTVYAIESYNWQISDTVFWYFYYPENDTATGKPTGEHPKGADCWLTYIGSEPCKGYWKFWGKSIWDETPNEGVLTRYPACGEENDLPGFGWGIRPAYIWHQELVFTDISFFPGKWYVELYKRKANGNKVFLKRDSCELRDTFTFIRISFPSDTDTVYGRENIILTIHENHWANVKLNITSISVLGGKNIDTTIEFHVYRMGERKGKTIPFDFGFEYGRIYQIVAQIEDYSGNQDSDTGFAVVGMPVIDVTLNPQEVQPRDIPGLPPNGNRTEVRVRVTSPSGRPVQGFPVNLTARAVLYSGGHDHDGNRPVGIFEQNHGQTNENGEFRTYYYATQFGGIERIIASGGNISDSADLTVRVPGLQLLPDATSYQKVGGTQYHHGPPNYQDDHNHWGQSYLIDAIYAIALNYVDEGGEIILINDISLPFGGLFDINGNWTVPHSTHRMGQNADIEGTGEEGKFRKPQEIEEIINEVARAFGINISYFWESTHYHFTITQGR